jgi:hypothetical protein
MDGSRQTWWGGVPAYQDLVLVWGLEGDTGCSVLGNWRNDRKKKNFSWQGPGTKLARVTEYCLSKSKIGFDKKI